MIPSLPVLLFAAVSQLPQPPASSPESAPVPQPQQQPASQGQSNRSPIKVKPGAQAIKEKDFFERTGYFHPFVRMPKFVLLDQKAIWTSPVHTAKSDIKWWLIFGGATGALIATDKYVERNAPNNATLIRIGNDASYLGEAYTLLPIAAGFYFIGTKMGSDHFREAGMLSFEALADVGIIELAVKSITDRARPYEGNGNGDFWASTSPRYNSGFPSGHTISTFAMGSVMAHEYPHKWWIKVLIYGYGAGVAGARLAADRHFPGDVFAGGVIGWFVGDYVYAKRHNPELGKKRTTAQAILSHLCIGCGIQ
jgi:membrane-associated phospholipid phosphatase